MIVLMGIVNKDGADDDGDKNGADDDGDGNKEWC